MLKSDACIINWIKSELRAAANAERAVSDKAYMKSEMDFYGISKPIINKLAKTVVKKFEIGDAKKLVRIAEPLWFSKYSEERSLSIGILAAREKLLEFSHFKEILSPWLNYLDNWGHLDEYCIRVLGMPALRDGRIIPESGCWVDSAHFWTRRAGLLIYLPLIRKTTRPVTGLAERCVQLAPEREFFIRKAIGWTLRELADRNVEEMAEIYRRICNVASGLTIREALRKLPPEKRNELLDLRDPRPKSK